jgi:hypothetical protein
MVIQYRSPELGVVLAEFETRDDRIEYLPLPPKQVSGLHDAVHWTVENADWVAAAVAGGVLRGAGQDIWIRFKGIATKLHRTKTDNRKIYVSLRTSDQQKVIVVDVDRVEFTAEELAQMFAVYESTVAPWIAKKCKARKLDPEDSKIRVKLARRRKSGPCWEIFLGFAWADVDMDGTLRED